MPNLCFKVRPGRKCAQLVRHVYEPSRKRSRTMTVGTLDLCSDPLEFPRGLTLRPGKLITDAERAAILAFLTANENPDNRDKRLKQVERIRQALQSSPEAADEFGCCIDAIQRLSQALPALDEETRRGGTEPWLSLRPRYLELRESWKTLLAAAQQAGIAKRYQRKGSLAADEM